MTAGNSKEYPVTHENEIKRSTDKARYDVATIKAILDEAHFVNVAFVDEDGMPQSLPMVHAVTVSASNDLTILLHGYHKGRLARLLPPETRVCISATLLDGLVLALSAFEHSINHRSTVCHGEVVPFSDDPEEEKAERWEAARQIVEHVLPGRWAGCRQPNAGEMATTEFVRVKVLSASAKVRTAGPQDEKRDVADRELVGKTWAGVVPVKVAYGAPEPSEGVNVVEMPAYIKEYMAKGAVPSG